jgi:hypothetical protein
MNGTWWLFSNAAAETSVLAFITTIHCSIAVLRRYRPRGDSNLLLLPSFFFIASPWFLSTPGWLGLAILSHLAWFIACEKLIPPSSQEGRASAATLNAPTPRAPQSARPQHAAAAVPVPFSPAVPEAQVVAARPARKQFQELDVLSAHAETPDIRTFRFARPAGF